MDKIKKSTNQDGPLFLNDHARPRTRRELLGQGFIGGMAMVAGPTLLGGLLGRSPLVHAQALDCGLASSAVASGIPFISIELAGGANIAGSNIMVGGPSGQRDALDSGGYELLGFAPNTQDQTATMDVSGQGLLFQADSAMLRGIRDKASQAALNNTNGCVFCARSANDTDNNPHNPLYGIAKTGTNGDLVTLVGSSNSESGARSASPAYMVDPSIRPTKIDRPSDATGLVDSGRLGDILSMPGDQDRVLATMTALSAMKLDKVREIEAIRETMKCSYIEAANKISKFGNPAALDPFDTDNSTNMVGIFDADNNGRDNMYRKTASVGKLVIEGYAGAGAITIGGYDYHNGTRSTGEIRDFEAGQCIGGLIEFAQRVGTAVAIYLYSDGSVSSDGNLEGGDGRGKGVWRGDNSSTAASAMLVFNPNAMPTMRTHQLGYYDRGGSVNRSALAISDNVSLLTESVVLNYLSLTSQEGKFVEIFPQSALGSDTTLDSYIAFEGLI